MRPIADFIIEHADPVATCAGPAPRRGEAQREIGALAGAAVAASNGRIVFVGAERDVGLSVDVDPGAVRIDARGCTVVPGFVDPHTHAIFAGDRRQELRSRLDGATYEEIAARGGGILSTVERTRAAGEEELIASTRSRLDEMIACGTTTCEVKSGYGLETEAELKQLRVARALDGSHPIDLVPTFLGAHEVPPEYKSTRDGYIRLVVEEMIPRVAAGGLAEWCDVFCEHGVFTPEESAAILRAGARAGLKPRVHADELGATGGSRVAAAVRARSADHLVYVDEEGADLLAAADVCAVLLPIAALYLKLGKVAPARLLIGRSVPVALATDVNPGGGLSPSMPFAMTLACLTMHMTLEEALVAATINAAWSLDRADGVGSLEPGKLMDAVIVSGTLVELLRVGVPAIRTVIKRGVVVYERG